MDARRPAVAIDGPTASGKSTVARGVARRLGFRYIDTGAMYRSVALAAIRRGVGVDDVDGLTTLAASVRIAFEPSPGGDRVLLDGEDVTVAIRSPEVSTASSLVSTTPGVREAMVALQRELAAEGGVVMEGRDIGTVVLPGAEVKVYLQATLEARAQRRYAELRGRGVEITLDEVRRQEAERDRRDATRAHSPLRAAEDAVEIDSTTRTPDEVVEEIVGMVRARAGGP